MSDLVHKHYDGSPNEDTMRHRVCSLLRFSMPMLCISVLQTVAGSLNVMYVGALLGPHALAATSTGNTLIYLVLGTMGGLSNSVMLVIGRAMGRGETTVVREIFAAAIMVGLVLACALGLLQWAVAPFALTAMNVPPDARHLALAYLRDMSVATPLMFLFSLLMMSMRGAGESRGCLRWMAIGVGVECVLTPALITGWGCLPAWGVEGAAVSSTLAQSVALGGLVLRLRKCTGMLCFSRCMWHWNRQARTWTIDIGREGLPICLQLLMGAAYAAVIATIVNDFGSSTTAAYALIMQAWNYVQMPAMAMASATAALSARHIGASRPDQLSALVRTSLFCNLIITGTLVSILLVMGPWLTLGLLPGDPHAQFVAHRLNSMGWSLLCFGASVILFAVIRAQGKFFVPLVTCSVTQYVVCWPFILFFKVRVFEDAVWWSFPVCYTLPLIVGLHQLRRVLWRTAESTESSTSRGLN